LYSVQVHLLPKGDTQNDTNVLLEKARSLTGVEGVVLHTWTKSVQQMFKIKTWWWLGLVAANRSGSPTLVSALRHPGICTLSLVPSSVIISALLHPNADDIVATCCQLLGDEDTQALRSFHAVMQQRLGELMSGLLAWSRAAQAQVAGDRKRIPLQSLQQTIREAGWSEPMSRALTATIVTPQAESRVWSALLVQLRTAPACQIERMLQLRWEPKWGEVDGEGGIRKESTASGSDKRSASPAATLFCSGGTLPPNDVISPILVPACPGATALRIYCDLDGTLADFQGGVCKILGGSPSRQCTQRQVWKAISRRPDQFFAALDWEDGGREVWAHLRSIIRGTNQDVSVTILTGIPEGEVMKRRASKGKLAWVRRELGPDVPLVCCSSNDKHLYSGSSIFSARVPLALVTFT
jgi:hypothetical protein